MLQMCSGHCLNLALLIVHRKRGVVVHLQALLVLLFLVHVLLLAALAAAAAACPAEAHHPGDNTVPWFQRVQRPGKEVPVAQHGNQEAWEARLHDVHHDHKDHQHRYGHADPYEDLPAGDGEPQDRQGHDEETRNQVDDGKPAVFGSAVTQTFSQPDRHACERNWIPQHYAKDVEKEMAQRDLQGKETPHEFDMTLTWPVHFKQMFPQCNHILRANL